jgi:molybdenum cofactor biosynthesis enzyme MoaA
MPYVPCRMEYPVEENPFESLCVDLTYKCNSNCTYCYNPIRSFPDMELSYFEEVCRRLPRPVRFKFLGGEPTLHPDIFRFVLAAARHKHDLIIHSNGRRFAERDFVKGLADLGVPLVAGMSLDGGYSREDAYQEINNERCLAWKMRALETLERYFVGRLCLSAIIVRALNESVVPELLDLAHRHRRIVRYIHIRTAGETGRWGKNVPYTLEELKEVVRPHFTEDQFSVRCVRESYCASGQGCGACYRFRPTHRLQISLIEFATPRAASCPKRGKLVDRKFLVQSFFENMMHNAETLMARVGGRP